MGKALNYSKFQNIQKLSAKRRDSKSKKKNKNNKKKLSISL